MNENTKLLECVKQLKQTEQYLQELEQQVHVLEAKNEFLVKENLEYQRKLSLLTNNFVGKLAMKLYHGVVGLLQKRH